VDTTRGGSLDKSMHAIYNLKLENIRPVAVCSELIPPAAAEANKLENEAAADHYSQANRDTQQPVVAHISHQQENRKNMHLSIWKENSRGRSIRPAPAPRKR
jgi:hypothetical protein